MIIKNFFAKLDRKYLKIATYAGLATLVTVFLGYAIYKSLPVLGVLKKLLDAVFKPIVLGGVIAYLILPMVHHTERQFKKMFPKAKKVRTVSVFLCMILIFAAILLFFALVSSKLITNINFNSITSLFETYSGELNTLIEKAREYLEKLNINIPNIGSSVSGAISSVAGVFSTLMFSVIFSIYFLIDGENLANYWGNVLHKLLSSRAIAKWKEIIADADKCFSGYIRGQSVDAIIVGVTVSIVFSLIKMPYAVVIGFITGFGNLIPYVGPTLGYIAVILANVINGFDLRMIIIGLVVLEIIMLIDGNILNPRLLAGAIQIHPLLVIASLLAGGAVGGILGMLLAVPVGAFIKLQFEKWLAKKEPPEEETTPEEPTEKTVPEESE